MGLVVGLTGPNASGKGEIAAYLGRLGFTVHSLSDIVREESVARGLSTGREDLIRVGNLLREEGGAGVLAQRILPRLTGKAVVDSIRNPAEVEVLRGLPRFVLVGVSAPVTARFERSRLRARPGDPTTIEEFRRREAQENTTDPRAQQLEATFACADERLDNSKELKVLQAAIDGLLERHLSG